MRFSFFKAKRPSPAENSGPASDDQRTQHERERREAGYRALFEIIDDGFCIIQFIDGPDGPLSDYVHIEANSGYERHTGIQGIVGKTVFDVAPNDGREWVKIYGEVLSTGKAIRFERQFSEIGRFIEVSARRVEPESLGQVAVLFRDVTDRKRAEAGIRGSEKRARENEERVNLALAAGAIVGTWVWDVPANAFIVDEALAEAMGLAPEQDRAALSLDILVTNVHPEDKDRLLQRINETLAAGGPYAQQFRVLQADGAYHWIEANGSVEHDRDGKPKIFSGVLMNIDARRAVEAERDRAIAELSRLNETLEQRVTEQTNELMAKEEALRQAHKMEAVGQLTGGLAHDFNNLLAACSGSLEMMRKRLDEGRSDDLAKYLDAAKSATDRAAHVTQRLLAFSRQQSLAPKPTDLVQLTRGMEDLVQRTVGPHIEVSTVASADVWPTHVDPNQLENALLNLCINARDAMPEGGQLTIRIDNCTREADQAQEGDLAPGDYVEVSVTDTGTGMDPSQIARAFDPFFTTKPMGEGTGLGLSMVYGFAQQTGGVAVIRSEKGMGTTVSLLLPRSLAPAEDAPPPAPEGRAVPDASGKTILVVEDEILVRMVVVDALRDRGFTVLEAGTGAEALDVLATETPIDLLLTDVGLPKGMNGRQLAQAARQARPTLKVVFVTGYDEGVALGDELLASDVDVVQKPFDLDRLIDKLAGLANAAE
ncbi:ATP-binding protein [Salipiger sp. PrR002]|uniref:ATP-binding protein n=1 Tax=Salipiger sp. PrR002 TaxID=2706489 RepID=UPI0013BD82C7|nr:ATP-binding protein [Salipiger sp. PrR002]NDW02496.1 response regulator [Salipiger sp. PrR002]NDW56160.1 response regulator [Salipiger sp. PrR004]